MATSVTEVEEEYRIHGLRACLVHPAMPIGSHWARTLRPIFHTFKSFRSGLDGNSLVQIHSSKIGPRSSSRQVPSS